MKPNVSLIVSALFLTTLASRAEETAVNAPASDALSMTVTTSRERFSQDKPVKFTITLKNTSDKEFLLYDVNWDYRRISVDIDGKWMAQPRMEVAIARPRPKIEDSVALAPGKTMKFDFDLSAMIIWEKDPKTPNSFSKQIDRLPPGKHRLTRKHTSRMNSAEGKYPHPHWTGTIEATSPEFEITPEK